MQYNRRFPSPNKLKKGPFVVKLLCGICIAQIIFTIYVAVQVLTAAMQPDKFVIGGGSVLSARQREVAQAIGELSVTDMKPLMEFNPVEEPEQTDDQPTQKPSHRFQRPQSILFNNMGQELDMNKLILSGNLEDESADNRPVRGREILKDDSTTLYPVLKKFPIRPLYDQLNEDSLATANGTAFGTSKANLKKAFEIKQNPSNFKLSHLEKSSNKINNKREVESKFEDSSSINQQQNQQFIQSTAKLSHPKSESHLPSHQPKKIQQSSNIPLEHYDNHIRDILLPKVQSFHSNNVGVSPTSPVVHIYGKAAIGRYLWSHIIGAELQADVHYPGTLFGQKNVNGVDLIYREGPGLVPGPSSPAVNSTHLVLVANGRTSDKVLAAKVWLDHLTARTPRPAVILIMLASERCENGWVKQYVSSGLLKAVLLTYDDPLVDKTLFYQWPLGVATYREFPVLSEGQVKKSRARPYSCSLHATLHSDSPSRQQLALLLRQYVRQDVCSVHFRESWQSHENVTTMSQYVYSLLDSDLALCPSGYNAETYRLYEAMEAGAVPVLHNQQPATAGDCATDPFRLLKEMEAPVLWLNTWYDLQALLDQEKRKDQHTKAERREQVRRWYANFKLTMRERLLTLIEQKLLLP